MAKEAPAGQPAAGKRRGFRIGLRFQFILWLTAFVIGIMAVVIFLVHDQQKRALDAEIRERGLALARALAANSVEPLDLGAEAGLDLMLLARELIQTSEDAEVGRQRLLEDRSFSEMVLEDVKRLGRPPEVAGVENEGVLYAAVVDPAGKVLASADALQSMDLWLDRMNQPYEPPSGTGLLVPGDGERTWDSPDFRGLYVFAVPILRRVAAGGEGAEESPAAAEPVEPAAPDEAAAGAEPAAPAAIYTATGEQYLGSVYLGLTRAIVRRALALAVAKLLLIAGAVLVVGALVAVLIAGLLVKPIHVLRDGVIEVGAGNVETQVKITRRDELGELATSFNEMTRGLAERELIRKAFGQYVSNSVLDDILKNPEAMKVGGAKRRITVVDSDVRGFTAMSSRMEPEEVVAVINAYLDAQAKIVLDYRGHIDRFVGDELYAIFGIPTEEHDDAERAVRCAWALREAVAGIVDERKARNLPHPRIGIGIDSGVVIAGNMGAQGVKLEYAVVGEPVNTAHDIMDAARDPDVPGGQVVLSERTYELVKNVVEVRELEPLTVHGRERPMRAFDLVGVKPAGAGA